MRTASPLSPPIASSAAPYLIAFIDSLRAVEIKPVKTPSSKLYVGYRKIKIEMAAGAMRNRSP